MTPSLVPTGEERALVAAAQAGDERAFRRLVEPHRRPVEVHCYRMLGSLQDAEDVTQETLLRAWRSLDRFERRSSVPTWLYRIATNACLDELERRPRRPGAVDPYPAARLEDLPAPIADPAARYALHEGMELAFLTAIQRLPGRQRAVLILRDVLGWTAREAAELLDSTVAATNSALQRARATIEDDGVAAHAVAPRAPHERELLGRFVDAWNRADMDAFVALLREDAVLRMPPRPSVAGAGALGRFWFTAREHAASAASTTRLEPVRANGRPAVTFYRREEAGDEPFAVMLLDVDADRIAGFDAWIDAGLARRFEA